MKKVEAIFRHIKIEDVRDALDKIGVNAMTVTEVKGSGLQRGYEETYRGTKMTIHLRPKIKLETIVDDAIVEEVVKTIVANARTGEIGDGKIFVTPVEDVIKIRTGEHGLAKPEQ